MKSRNIKDEASAWAVVFSNTHRKKRPDDLITVAEAFKFLMEKYDQKVVAEKAELSQEMVRQFLSVLKLPPEVKDIIAAREIDSVDIAKEIAALNDSSKQIAAAQAVLNSLSKDVRDIKRLIKKIDIPAKDAKRVILDAKGLRIFIIDFDDEVARAIVKHAKAKKVEPAELVKTIVLDWLARKEKE